MKVHENFPIFYNRPIMEEKEMKAILAKVVSGCAHEKLKKYAAHALLHSIHV